MFEGLSRVFSYMQMGRVCLHYGDAVKALGGDYADNREFKQRSKALNYIIRNSEAVASIDRDFVRYSLAEAVVSAYEPDYNAPRGKITSLQKKLFPGETFNTAHNTVQIPRSAYHFGRDNFGLSP